MACRVQNAASCIGNVCYDCYHFQTVREAHCAVSSALWSEAENAAGSVRHVFFRQCMVFAVRKACILNPCYLRMVFQELCHFLGISAVALHAQVQGLQADIRQECILRGLACSHIAHQLCGCFGDICFFAEFLGINNTVVRFIRCGKTREFVCMRIPVKVSGINNRSAERHCMAVHVFCGGMGDNIYTELERTAVDRGCKGVVADHRNAVLMCKFDELVDIQHNTCRVGNRLGKDSLCVRLECFFQLFCRRILVHEGSLDTESF